MLVKHANPYDRDAILQLERSLGLPSGIPPLIMRNPPFGLVLALPLGFVGPKTGSLLWFLLSLSCLVASVRMVWSMHGRPKNHLHWLGYSFVPVLACLLAGQMSLLILLGLGPFLALVSGTTISCRDGTLALYVEAAPFPAIWCRFTRLGDRHPRIQNSARSGGHFERKHRNCFPFGPTYLGAVRRNVSNGEHRNDDSVLKHPAKAELEPEWRVAAICACGNRLRLVAWLLSKTSAPLGLVETWFASNACLCPRGPLFLVVRSGNPDTGDIAWHVLHPFPKSNRDSGSGQCDCRNRVYRRTGPAAFSVLFMDGSSMARLVSFRRALNLLQVQTTLQIMKIAAILCSI